MDALITLLIKGDPSWETSTLQCSHGKESIVLTSPDERYAIMGTREELINFAFSIASKVWEMEEVPENHE